MPAKSAKELELKTSEENRTKANCGYKDLRAQAADDGS